MLCVCLGDLRLGLKAFSLWAEMSYKYSMEIQELKGGGTPLKAQCGNVTCAGCPGMEIFL